MERSRKFFKAIIFEVLLIIFLLIIYIRPIYADSSYDGYDTFSGYDSYSSYYDYDSYDRYDYYDDDYYEDDYFSLDSIIMFGIICAVIAVIYFLGGIAYNNKHKSKASASIFNSSIEKTIKSYLPDFNEQEFLSEAYNIYINVQNAWMNFKLDDVKDLMTEELYSRYNSELLELQIKREKNVMEGFRLINSLLNDVIVDEDTITVTTKFVIDFYDYVIAEMTREVLRGSDDQKIRVTYEMKFERSLTPNDSKKWVLCGKKTIEQDFI